MISNSAVLLALRNRALSLVVATTGSVSLSATATGFALSRALRAARAPIVSPSIALTFVA